MLDAAEVRGLFIKACSKLDDELNKQVWADAMTRLAASPRAVDRKRYLRFGEYMKGRG